MLAHNRNAALYCRLSRDDNNISESDSIQNQELILKKYAEQNGFSIVDVYKDDGYTGTNFQRPDFVRMLGDLRRKKADTVIVKDLSRFGREHIQADLYREIEFPQMGVRLIAINDNYDGARLDRSANSMAQMKGLFNEWMAAETSEKVRDVLRSKKEAGQFVTKVPYGYQRNPADRHKLVVDEAAALIVRRIYDMMIAGTGYDKIAKTLSNERILTPAAHSGTVPRSTHHEPYDWNYTTVRTILTNPTYLGHTVQGKYTTISYKVKQAVKVPEEQWIRVENTHEPIISQETWDMAQSILSSRKRSTKKGAPHMFAGLLKCATCDSTLAKNSKDIFSCHRYKTQGKDACTNHHISLEKLTAVVLGSIRAVSRQIRDNRDRFMQRLSGVGEAQRQQKLKVVRKERDVAGKRLTEIPALLKKAFEQNATGLLPDELYTEMMAGYQKEREELAARLEAFNTAIAEAEQDSEGIQSFIGMIEKYIDIQELDSVIIHELIEKIVVHQTVKADGQRKQQIDIYYRFIGKL